MAKQGNGEVPIEDRYNSVMRSLGVMEDDEKFFEEEFEGLEEDDIRKIQAQLKEMKKELFGHDVVTRANPEYFLQRQIFSLPAGILDKWDTMSTRRKGKALAVQELGNMAEIIERHESNKERRAEERARKRESKNAK